MVDSALIADPEVEQRMKVRKHLLRGLGDISVFDACNGEDAIDILVENGRDIEMVFLSVDMPDTNGWETLRIIRDPDNWPDMKVIMMTDGWDENLKAYILGADHFIPRDFDTDQFQLVLDNAMRRPLGAC
jgi:CheY-like chemotaxis protein